MKYKVTLINYDPKKNFSYEVDAVDPWEAFLKQPSSEVTGDTQWRTWEVEAVPTQCTVDPTFGSR